MTEPEFTAFELNKLSNFARKDSYYQNVKDFVDRFGRGALKWKDMTEKQRRWLWSIKIDLKGELEEEGE